MNAKQQLAEARRLVSASNRNAFELGRVLAAMKRARAYLDLGHSSWRGFVGEEFAGVLGRPRADRLVAIVDRGIAPRFFEEHGENKAYEVARLPLGLRAYLPDIGATSYRDLQRIATRLLRQPHPVAFDSRAGVASLEAARKRAAAEKHREDSVIEHARGLVVLLEARRIPAAEARAREITRTLAVILRKKRAACFGRAA